MEAIAQTNNKTALPENTAPNVILCTRDLSAKALGGISLPGRLQLHVRTGMVPARQERKAASILQIGELMY